MIYKYYRIQKAIFKFPYHISNWIYFGKTNDLLKIWDGELIDDNDYFTEQDIKKRLVAKEDLSLEDTQLNSLFYTHF
ncbi:WavE lipopolysaccharide synthesis family protein [Escherichia coli]